MAVARELQTLVTEEEFLALPESMDRVELLDGEVIVSPSPSDRHQRILVSLVSVLFYWAGRHPPAAVRVAPLDVRFGPSRILQPDLFVVLAGIPEGATTPLDLVPDLVVEVLSSRRSYDRITKRVLYAEARVPEYWVVDPEAGCVEVYRGGDPAVAVRDTLRSAQLPGLEIDVGGLLRG